MIKVLGPQGDQEVANGKLTEAVAKLQKSGYLFYEVSGFEAPEVGTPTPAEQILTGKNYLAMKPVSGG
jgi:hypothetical protein